MGSPNVDLVCSILAAWERGDFSSTEWAHPDIEFAFGDGPEPGSSRGVAGMAAIWRGTLGAFEEYRVRAHEYRVIDDERVLVFVYRSGHGKISGGWTSSGCRHEGRPCSMSTAPR
jgi:ketosteroid isomerase-like protein